MIDLDKRHLDVVVRILAFHVPGREVRVFGSRVNGSAKQYSDLDLLLMGPGPISPRKRALLEEAFSESDLPFKVDLVDWADASEEFRQRAFQGSEIIGNAIRSR